MEYVKFNKKSKNAGKVGIITFTHLNGDVNVQSPDKLINVDGKLAHTIRTDTGFLDIVKRDVYKRACIRAK